MLSPTRPKFYRDLEPLSLYAISRLVERDWKEPPALATIWLRTLRFSGQSQVINDWATAQNVKNFLLHSTEWTSGIGDAIRYELKRRLLAYTNRNKQTQQ